MTLLLASQSITRRRMLEQAGVPFQHLSSGFDEERSKAGLRSAGAGAADIAAGLSAAKALHVSGGHGDLVLGADQTLELDDGSMLDKPVSRADLEDQLRRLSGRTHHLHAGAALAEDGKIVWRQVERVSLHVRTLSKGFISRYLDAEYDAIRFNVGGYRIEARGIQLFERIEGSHFAILGLPLLPLLGYLRERGMMES